MIVGLLTKCPVILPSRHLRKVGGGFSLSKLDRKLLRLVLISPGSPPLLSLCPVPLCSPDLFNHYHGNNPNYGSRSCHPKVKATRCLLITPVPEPTLHRRLRPPYSNRQQVLPDDLRQLLTEPTARCSAEGSQRLSRQLQSALSHLTVKGLEELGAFNTLEYISFRDTFPPESIPFLRVA